MPVEDGKLTIVYAWGSAEDGNLAVAVQSITVGHSTPGGVNSGTAGYAAERDAMNQAFGIIGIAFAAAAASVAVFLVRRSRAVKIDS